MYLKALELQGFKSFADKTLLNFDGEITAIVGPNGSGKSNISDAIRWVLGEQSTKSLRGAKMEDVIFGGTQKRSQVGYAEASLILDNSDSALSYDAAEVMITRRYFRSGESEYYINKQQVRLRDILEIFMDTGLGREGYSNIGQGHIDEILSLKSTERREIFEEAAGISKYRHRKEETERKLDSTEENLVRIGDKIQELELQLNPLREQADKAQKYLSFKSELKGLEITAWMHELESLAAERTKAESDYNSSSFILNQQNDSLNALYRETDDITQQVVEHDTALSEQRERIAEITEGIQQLEAEKSVIRSDIKNKQDNIERIQGDLTLQENRIAQLEGTVSDSKARIEEIVLENEKLNEEYRALEAEAEEVSRSGQEQNSNYIQTEKTLSDVYSQKSSALNQVSALEENLRYSDEKEKNLSDGLAELNARYEEEQSRESELKRTVRDSKEKIDIINNQLSGYRIRMENLNSRLQLQKDEFNTLQIGNNTAKSRLKMLEDMERSYDGYSRAVRSVLQEAARGTLRNIIGTVSSVIHVEDEHATAIEAALGNEQQFIIVDSEYDGKAAFNYLKRTNNGRATFLPMKVIRGRMLNERGLEDFPGVVGIASDLVKHDPKYTDIVRSLLGRTVIAEDIDDAIHIAKSYQNRFKIVTLDGQVINAGGSMTGGSTLSGMSFLSRKNEIEHLKEDIEKTTTKFTALEADIKQLEQKTAACQYETELLSSDLRTAEDEKLRAESNLSGSETLIGTIEESIERQKNEIQGEKNSRARISELMKQSKTYIVSLGEQITELENKRDLLRVDNEANGAKLSELSDKLSQLQSKQSSLQAEKDAAEKNVVSLAEMLSDLNGESGDKEALISTYRNEISEMEDKLRMTDDEIAEKQNVHNEESLSYQVHLKERNDLDARKTKASKEIQELNKNIVVMERESARLLQKKQSAEQNEKVIIDKLWDNYNLTRSSAGEFVLETESISATQKRISELRRKISALGTPNIGAIEEFNRVNERWEYLDGQRNDVDKAKQELSNILRSITKEMTAIFTSEFEKINDNFSHTFVEMFGGGKAALLLEDPENPLDCGIEIKVQPPGKQLKTITLLSGGEKAFVAIALYLSILKVRPTPFCMLDEIDAALDENNVHKFASYLKTLSHSTQFIVITHRRGTMEQADTLYGVTMQEQGVSKMLHLNLNEMVEELGIEA